MAKKAKKLVYDPDLSHREKHRWNEDRAEIISQEGAHVGKCPSSIDDAEAQRMLERGIEYRGRNSRKARPERVYNVRGGVPYRAHIMGTTYHGFPEVPSELPPELLSEIRSLADDEGTTGVFDAWMERYGQL